MKKVFMKFLLVVLVNAVYTIGRFQASCRLDG